MIGEFVGALMATLIGGAIGPSLYDRHRRRGTAAAFRSGRDVTFPGWVLGRTPYCREPGGLLVVTGDGIHHVVATGMPITRRDLPVDRLRAVRVRTRGAEDDMRMPHDWAVLECFDGEEPVRIACDRKEMYLVEARLNRKPDDADGTA